MKRSAVVILCAVGVFVMALPRVVAPRVLAQSAATPYYFPYVSKASGSQTSTPTPTPTPTLSASGAYTQTGGTAALTDRAFAATHLDESGVYVTSAGVLTLSDSTVTTSGNTSSNDNSSFYGINAGILANAASKLTLSGLTVTTSGTGANGVFAYGSGTAITITDSTISATGQGGHGIMATGTGSILATNLTITTTGTNSAPVATDRGSGTIRVIGGRYTSTASDSPGLYSTGVVTVSGATITATGCESAVIEGANSITLTNTTLSSNKADKWGVLIYQSMSGDAEGTEGTFAMTGGSLSHTPATGPLFYVTNSTGHIALQGVTVSVGSGILIKAASGSWGTSGSNGGTAVLIANGQTLTGSLVADSYSSFTATLKNSSTLAGQIDSANTAKTANLVLDASSAWTVTGISYLTCLSDPSGISGTTITNITGNGYTVYYDSSACSALGGLTYTLSGGGYLQPES